MNTLLRVAVAILMFLSGCDSIGLGNDQDNGQEIPGENTDGGENTGNGGGDESGDEEPLPDLPEGVTRVTVGEFLAAEVSDVWYGLTGTITYIEQDIYGDFDLTDETGTVYVYGLTATRQEKNDQSFSSLGLKVGDVVTIVGQRGEYKGKDEVTGPAYYISHVPGDGSSPDQPDVPDIPDNPGGNPGYGVPSGWLELPAECDIPTASVYDIRPKKDGPRNYTSYYDSKTYSSLWIAYPLAKGHMGSGRSNNWSFAPQVPQDIQVDLTNGSYNDGYSRGHQIANGDRNGISAMQSQTFYVINSVPQIQDDFNGGIWNKLEIAIRDAVPSGDSLYVVTGPVYQTVGGSESIKYTTAKKDSKKLPVANYFFKVVLKVKRSGNQLTGAKAVGFWFKHKTYSDSYENYAVSVDEIEKLTGYDFFVNLPDELEAVAEQNSSWSSFRSF